MTLCSRFLAFALALGVALPLKGADEPKPKPAEGKPIDLVLCLDVSGSMDGLIDSAKLRLWDIVNETGPHQADPEPPRRAVQLRRRPATTPTRAG